MSHLKPSGEYVVDNATLEDAGKYFWWTFKKSNYAVLNYQEPISVIMMTIFCVMLILLLQTMCHYKSLTLLSLVHKTTQTIWGENHSPRGKIFSDFLCCRVLGISTAISIFALATLVSGIALLLFRNRSARKQQLKDSPGEDESLELVPNITLNPVSYTHLTLPTILLV